MPPNGRGVWNSTLTRHTPLRGKGWLDRKSKLRQIGKKGKANIKANRAIDKELARFGIKSCEVKYQGCTGSFGITRAHSKKRMDIKGDEIKEAVYACLNCHNILEAMKKSEMTRIVREIIAARQDSV